VLVCELSCTRDTLPPPLGQLAALQRLAVRRGVVSEGLLVTEYDCLAQLTGGSGRVAQQCRAWE
jgi:hypothetical protein